MKITIKKEILVAALQTITPITDKSSSRPILSNFLLSSDEDGQELHFCATDYEISIQGKVPAQVQEGGSTCINAAMVLGVCREFLSEEVLIESDPQLWVSFSADSSKLRLPSVDVGLYPKIEMNPLAYAFRLSSKNMKKCIDYTIFATQTNEARRNLMGVNLSFNGDTLCCTATDGHRLARVEEPVEAVALQDPPEIIVPRKALQEMQKILERSDEKVTISFDPQTLLLSTEKVMFSTRLIEGKFPNVEQVIPKDNDKSVTLDRERMVNALKIISLMSSDAVKPVKLSLDGTSMKVESKHGGSGEAENELEVGYQGEEMNIGFNARYLLDVLGVTMHKDITMELKGPLNPCLIRLQGDEGFLSVVMPMRIEW